MKSEIKGVPVSPLTGILDARSSPDQLAAGALRFRQNFQTIGNGKLRRGTGWSKLLSSSNYNNEDFHDQLLTFTAATRQPITLITKAVSTRRAKSLIVATQRTIAKLNEYSGNWRILGTGYGGTPSLSAASPRFHTAQVGDYLGCTNGIDLPMYHQLEGSSTPALQTFDDLAVIGLTQANLIWEWHNVLFFADVVMDQERFAYRIVWGDFNNPTSFDPAKLESIAGFQDLYTHERILGGRALFNSFLIYTTHGIWEMNVTGQDPPFAFTRRYNGEENEGAGVLKYPNTLASLPDAHIYGAEDGIYIFSPYQGKPNRAEWLHAASSLLYDNIDDVNCSVHVAKVNKNELLFSAAQKGDTNQCPSRTLRVNTTYQVADFIDAGFTAINDYESYKVPTIRDFILTNCICTVEDLIAAGYGWVLEGLPRPVPGCQAAFVPQSFYTSQPFQGGSLDGLLWQLPVTVLNSPGEGQCVNPADQVVTMDGVSGVLYDVWLLFRGIMEGEKVTGGAVVTDTGGHMYAGGSPTADGHNIYKMVISDPPQTYYLNQWDGVENYGDVHAIRYTVRVQIRAGATITLSADSVGGTEVANSGNLVITPLAGEPPILVTQPFGNQGQFLQMDVTLVTAPDDVVTENFNKAEADADSLCALLGDQKLDDICGKCEGASLLVAASSIDWCLKQIGDVFYREMCVNPDAIGTTSDLGYASSVGSYLLEAYDSILRFAPVFAGDPLIHFEALRLNFVAKPQTPASVIGLRVGISGQVSDPNTDTCIVWHQHSSKELKCFNRFTAIEYERNTISPSEPLNWSFLRVGRIVYAELKISGTGGDSIFSGVVGDVKAVEARNY